MQGPQECRLDDPYMTSAEVIFSLPILKDSNCIYKDTGPLGCPQGLFLKTCGLHLNRNLLSLSGGPRTGNHILPHNCTLFYLSWAF